MMISSISTSQIASSLFSKLDTKSQDYIEKADLETAFSSISSDSDSTSVDELFTALDSDSDGKVTEDEMSSGLDTLMSQLNSQFDSMRMQGGQGMPPPPPPTQGEDEGYTQDELTSIASSTDDSQLASLMTEIAENFDAADTNQDGKVTGQEAMAYKESSSSSDSPSTSTSTSSLSQIAQQIQQLITAYGLDSSSASSLSYTA